MGTYLCSAVGYTWGGYGGKGGVEYKGQYGIREIMSELE